MIVGQDDRGSIDVECLLDELPRMDTRSINRAAEQFLELQDAVTVVQIQATKHLVGPVPQARLQEGLGVRGAPDRRTPRQRFLEITPREFREGSENRQPRSADAGLFCKRPAPRVE